MVQTLEVLNLMSHKIGVTIRAIQRYLDLILNNNLEFPRTKNWLLLKHVDVHIAGEARNAAPGQRPPKIQVGIPIDGLDDHAAVLMTTAVCSPQKNPIGYRRGAGIK